MPPKTARGILDHLRGIAEDPHAYAQSLQRNGRLVAGYMCTHVPEEILYAAGIVPVRILTSHTPQAVSHSYIHETYCSFSHDCAYQGLDHHYDYLDLVVTASSCIHMSEAFNVWVRFAGFQSKSYLVPYPHIMQTKPARGFLTETLADFKRFVEKTAGRKISDEDIESAIGVYNRNRRLLKQLWELLKLDRPPISAPDLAAVTLAAQVMDKRECNEILEQLVQKLAGKRGKVPAGIRIMATGGACDHTGVLDLVEQLGYPASLVFVDSCTAARYFWFEVPEGRPDKIEAIAEGYLGRIPCPAKDVVLGTGEKERLRFVQQFIKDYRPDAVVFLYQRFCSPQPMDVVAFKPVLQKLGIPSTELELDTTVPVAQFGTQLEALVELTQRVAPDE